MTPMKSVNQMPSPTANGRHGRRPGARRAGGGSGPGSTDRRRNVAGACAPDPIAPGARRRPRTARGRPAPRARAAGATRTGPVRARSRPAWKTPGSWPAEPPDVPEGQAGGRGGRAAEQERTPPDPARRCRPGVPGLAQGLARREPVRGEAIRARLTGVRRTSRRRAMALLSTAASGGRGAGAACHAPVFGSHGRECRLRIQCTLERANRRALRDRAGRADLSRRAWPPPFDAPPGAAGRPGGRSRTQ